MKSKVALRTIAISMGTMLSLGSLGLFAGCKSKANALVIMTEDLNELYNPFYSTTGTDMDVVGQTQISMLSTNENGELVCGKDEPTVVLDYDEHYDPATDKTVFTYVLKNGLKFSDGVPLTMNDVMFNLYVYLDPAYTGSTTMYSTDIEGLQAYRTQSNTSDDTQDDELDNQALEFANNRKAELVSLFKNVAQIGVQGGRQYATVAEMNAAIDDHACGNAYLEAIGTKDQTEARAQLKEDYQNVLTKFREELQSDFKNARSSYTEEPYSTAPVYYNEKQVRTGFDDIVSFMYAEHLVELEYPQTAGSVPDKSKIEKAILNYNYDTIKTQEQAINFVYNSNVQTAFDQILDYWATGTQVLSEYTAKAKDVILHGTIRQDELTYKSISGIVSLGHTTDQKKVTITHKDGGTAEYQVAQEHNEDGTPKNAQEHDVLRITVNGVDPKAKWNFGFTVAPYHYYSDKGGNTDLAKKNLGISDSATPEELLRKHCWENVVEVDIEHNKFGVAWADSDFQSGILQGENTWGVRKTKVPLGAGPYIASDEGGSDKPTAEGFFQNNIVYYEANENFSLNGVEEDGGKFVPKTKKMRYVEISTANALASLESGQVQFVSPQFTKENTEKIDSLKKRGIGSMSSWQLGYGYIGINAAKVKQLELRKAIMAAMNTKLALSYYQTGTAVNVYWPMSAVSWAYPRTPGNKYDGAYPTRYMEDDNGQGHEYTKYQDEETARNLILQYMSQADYKPSDLTVEFVLAGANMYDHPAYLVFKNAMDLLNSLGWNVTIKPDANALIKLSTGSLAVWAAAWGSTIDPDMYQVYHKNSTATSVLAWGYPSIKTEAGSEYTEEKRILNDLSDKIDDAREIDDSTEEGKQQRADLYKEAMGLVLDLAVELPLYQRMTLYAYDLNVIDETTMPDKINPYTSPLSRIWEIGIK